MKLRNNLRGENPLKSASSARYVTDESHLERYSFGNFYEAKSQSFYTWRKLSNSLRKKYEWWNIYITPLRGGRYAGTNYIKKYSKDEKPPQKICSVLVNLTDTKSIEFASKLMHYTSESLDEALRNTISFEELINYVEEKLGCYEKEGKIYNNFTSSGKLVQGSKSD